MKRTFRESITCWGARRAISVVSSLRWPRFRKLLDKASQQQRDWLLHRVRISRDTRFGRDHGFDAIASVDEFRKRVPITKYDAFAPYINAVAAGEVSALVPESERLLRFTITTGSSGAPKLNPVTNTWLREYRQAWDIWGLKLFADHPAHLGEQLLQLAGKWEMGRTPGGFSISMVSALLAREQNPMIRPFYAVPSPVNDIADPIARYYTALRIAMVKHVGFIVLMNPGLLVRIAELGDEHKESLIRDIRDGSLSDQFEIPREIRESLRSEIARKNPRRAAELEQLAASTGRLYPRDYWNSPVVACWLGGTAGFQKRAIPQYYGDCAMRDMGLVSSEGRHTIPLEDDKPEGVPSIVSGFYEYLPVDEEGSQSPIAIDGRDLEVGRDYYLLMTTAGGFYRYNIGDVVRCTGFVGEAPLLEFLQKGDRCGDLEGEKLTEHQFLEMAHAAAESLSIPLGETTAVPSRDAAGRPKYLIVAEEGGFPNQAAAAKFLGELDRRLMSINFLYSARRREQVLDSPELHLIPTGEWAAYIRRETDRRGTGDYQYKHPGMVQDPEWIRQFPIKATITCQ